MSSYPTPCRIVLYHFTVVGDDHKVERRARPAVVTSVGPSDDVLNLWVLFEPDDCRDENNSTAPHRFSVAPFDPANPQAHRWSWPPRN